MNGIFMKKKEAVVAGFGIIIVLLIIIQFVPVTLTNPRVESDMPAPPDVKAILKVSCYDCHSHETLWPWYSKVAPMSWLLASDAEEGREKLNFSAWNKYPPEKQSLLIAEAMDEVREGGMPPWFYVIKHSAAKISLDKLKVLETWAGSYQKAKTAKGE
jgi:hypothetical protein